MSNALGAAGELAIRSLIERAPLASSLAQAFKAKGFTLALVGGPVRDAILGRLGNDLDFTTNAHPLETKKILQVWAENVWDTGIEFGTVAGKRGDTTVEVTTYRTEKYEEDLFCFSFHVHPYGCIFSNSRSFPYVEQGPC